MSDDTCACKKPEPECQCEPCVKARTENEYQQLLWRLKYDLHRPKYLVIDWRHKTAKVFADYPLFAVDKDATVVSLG